MDDKDRDVLTVSSQPTQQEPKDPHPSDEEHYDQTPRPGGAKPLGKDIGPNPSVHDGKPKPMPKNASTE